MTDAPPPLPARTLWALTIGCGLAVANLYYAQPLLPDIAAGFGVSDRLGGLAVTLAQVGYAAGMLLLVPLGDVLERRGLILATLLAVAPQLIVPFAAALAPPERRGRVVGTVMSGLLIGVLGSRTASGFLGAHLGWRTVYVLAAVLMLALAGVLRLVLPASHPGGPRPSYGRLIGSVGGLLRDEPVLRQSCLFGALGFGAFSAY